jgi:hypothetical protein
MGGGLKSGSWSTTCGHSLDLDRPCQHSASTEMQSMDPWLQPLCTGRGEMGGNPASNVCDWRREHQFMWLQPEARTSRCVSVSNARDGIELLGAGVRGTSAWLHLEQQRGGYGIEGRRATQVHQLGTSDAGAAPATQCLGLVLANRCT